MACCSSAPPAWGIDCCPVATVLLLAPTYVGANAGGIAAKLQSIVDVNQLQRFYPPGKVQALAAQVAQTVNFDELAAR